MGLSRVDTLDVVLLLFESGEESANMTLTLQTLPSSLGLSFGDTSELPSISG